VGITAGSREVPGRKACDKRHPYRIMIVMEGKKESVTNRKSKCRLCQQFEKKLDYISACPILAKEQYMRRHDGVCTVLHFKICKEVGAKSESEQWHDRVPKLVERSHEGKVVMLWDVQVQTDRTVPNSKPDSIVCGNDTGTCVLIDGAIGGGRNVIKREAEKILKYRDRTVSVQCVENVKVKVIPVIIGVIGTIRKSFRQYLSKIPADHDFKEQQKTVLRCVIPVVCRKTKGEVNISHENTTMVVWIYDGI